RGQGVDRPRLTLAVLVHYSPTAKLDYWLLSLDGECDFRERTPAPADTNYPGSCPDNQAIAEFAETRRNNGRLRFIGAVHPPPRKQSNRHSPRLPGTSAGRFHHTAASAGQQSPAFSGD